MVKINKLPSLTRPLLHFLDKIMFDALKEHDGQISIRGKPITNLRFADDIDAFLLRKSRD